MQRNRERFPDDFMFQLTGEEDDNNLRSQSVMSNPGWGGRRYSPYAFTEQGLAMLSSVLRSQRAVQVNIEIMRALIRLREMLASPRDLAARLDELEHRYDAQFKAVFDAIRQLMAPPAEPRPLGFKVRISVGSIAIRMRLFRPICSCALTGRPGNVGYGV